MQTEEVTNRIEMYYVEIKGLKSTLLTPSAKTAWSYVTDHYNKLSNENKHETKMNNFNYTVLRGLASELDHRYFDKDTYKKIHNLELIEYSVTLVTRDCGGALEKGVFAELVKLPTYVSDQAVVALLNHLNDLDIGLKFGIAEIIETAQSK